MHCHKSQSARVTQKSVAFFVNELYHAKNQSLSKESKHSVNHVFSSPTSIINFTSKKPSYDDTRRSGRDNELLQRAQNDL